MRRIALRFTALALAALFAAEPGGCGLSGNGGADSQPKPPAPDVVVFQLRVTGISGRVLTRKVQMTIIAFNAAGRPAEITDPDTGQRTTTPYIVPIFETPSAVRLTREPGIVVLEVKMVYLGTGGDFVICWIEKDNGLELRGSYNRKQVPTGPRGRGGQEVSCEYLGP